MIKVNQIIEKLLEEKYFLPAIFSLALLLRIAGSVIVGLAFDERLWLKAANQVTFSPKNFHIAFHGIFHPFFEVYLIKLSTLLFNHNFFNFIPSQVANRFSIRFLHVILSSGTILIIYYLVKDGLERSSAIFAALLIAFSQFHIHFSRTVIQTAPLLFFVTLSILFFWKAVNEDSNKYIIFSGITIGLGYLCEETAVFLFLIFVIFLLITKKFIPWIKKKETYIAILSFLVIISPDLYWNIISQNSAIKYHLTRAFNFKGISLLPTSLFTGELFLIFVKDLESFTGGFTRNAVWSLEYPPMHWILGLSCLVAIIYSFKKHENDFVRLMQITFFTIFIFFTIFASHGPLGNFNFWWASICFIPAIVLLSNLLSDFSKINLFLKFTTVAFVVYLFFHSILFLSIRDNVYVRRPSFLSKYYINSGRMCLLRGKISWAIDNFEKALKYNPKSAPAMVNLAECFKIKNQYHQANDFEKKAQNEGLLPADLKRFVLDKGYLKEWLIFRHPEASHSNGHLANVLNVIDSFKKVKMKQEVKNDNFIKIASSSAFIDLKKVLNSPPNTYSYAFTQIYSPVNQKVKILVGVDDGLTIWLNRKKVYENNEKLIWFPDEDTIDVSLNQGWNNFLLRVFYDRGHSYGFTIRLSNNAGGIIDNIKYKTF